MINEMIGDLAQDNIFKTSETLTMVDGTRTYSFTATAQSIFEILDDDNEPVEPTTKEQLNELDADWRDSEGDTYFYIWELESNNSVSFYKKPSSTEDGAEYTAYIYYRPDDVGDTSTDYLPKPIRERETIAIHYALEQIFSMRSDIQDRDAAKTFMAKYQYDKMTLKSDRRNRGKTYVYGSAQPSRTKATALRLPDNYPKRWY